VFFGQPTMTGYTIETDVRGREQRRQRGDVGLINERYGLVLFGNGQKLELHPWQAADEMTGARAVRLGRRQVVSHEAARRSAAGRHGARARQGVAVRRSGARGVDDRERSTRSRTRWAARGIYADGIPKFISIT
jgi:hypothetical protein